MRDWKQKLAIYLLVFGLTLLALSKEEYRFPIIGMLVPLVVWVIERKDKIEKEEQRKEQGIKKKEKGKES